MGVHIFVTFDTSPLVVANKISPLARLGLADQDFPGKIKHVTMSSVQQRMVLCMFVSDADFTVPSPLALPAGPGHPERPFPALPVGKRKVQSDDQSPMQRCL